MDQIRLNVSLIRIYNLSSIENIKICYLFVWAAASVHGGRRTKDYFFKSFFEVLQSR